MYVSLHLLILLFASNIISNIQSIQPDNMNNCLSGYNNSFFKTQQIRRLNPNENDSNNLISFAEKSFGDMIKDNIAIFVVIIVAIVVIIIVIIILIIFCRKMNKRYNDLQTQVNKISFQVDNRETKQNDDDRLI